MPSLPMGRVDMVSCPVIILADVSLASVETQWEVCCFGWVFFFFLG
jgi:hypothetical protein